MSDIIRKLRCTKYVRTSSEEGLSQAFNSLDAQDAACEAFIESQKAEGWVSLPDPYSDGGFSGGNLSRPALQRLLKDIREGLVDCVVVYKIDRLSRSLADFAKLVDIFDAHHVTFVSVTQSFSTVTSMGRLTLNILLSFAQFERELGGERVRDKICASRKRGLWMGGMPPLGYNVRERKLVPNAIEVKLVKRIFERFIALGSVTTLTCELRAEGVTTKSWTTIKQIDRVGRLIEKKSIYRILRNPVVIGIARYKMQDYLGEHPAIIERSLWDQAQSMLDKPDSKERAAQNRPARAPALLKGLIFGDDGIAMTPGATKKKDRYYRYYIHMSSIRIGKDACSIARVPAGEIEAAVIGQVRKVLSAPEVVAHTIREVLALDPAIDAQQTILSLQNVEQVWDELFPAEQARIIQLLVDRVVVSPTGVRIDMKTDGIKELVQSVIRDPELKMAA